MTEKADSAGFRCVRCNRTSDALPVPPVPDEQGQEIQQKVCAPCWAEWQQAEVMVINELRLNFMEPAALETLDRHMRDFLLLDGPPAT